VLIIAYPRDPAFLTLTPFIKLDPQLVVIDHLLQDRKLILLVATDLALSAPQALWNGRPATPVVVTLRVAVARRLNNWSYRTVEKEINGSMQWRWFCALEAYPCPDFSTLRDREALIRPATLHRVNDRVAQLAQREGVTQGQKLRADGSVTETHIHYPTDSNLLADCVRVIGRTLTAARCLLKPRSQSDKQLFRDSHRRAKHLARQIAQRLRGTKGQKTLENKAQRLYRRLVKVTEESVAHAWDVVLRLKKHATLAALALVATLEHYLPLVCQVIDQTTRRVFQHENVPASDKIVSLFEPHTAIIQRGKARPNETEFGRKVWYCESDGGIITDYRLLQGNPPEANYWLPSLKHQRKLFGHPPKIATADRGVYSPENEQAAKDLGVKRVVLPKPGAKSRARQHLEDQPWFKAVRRWRSGVEGRISHLRRARGLDHCFNHGEAGMERWLGWGVIANNLMVIATTLTRPHRSAKKCRT
jgi:transposase, IS5 family